MSTPILGTCREKSSENRCDRTDCKLLTISATYGRWRLSPCRPGRRLSDADEDRTADCRGRDRDSASLARGGRGNAESGWDMPWEGSRSGGWSGAVEPAAAAAAAGIVFAGARRRCPTSTSWSARTALYTHSIGAVRLVAVWRRRSGRRRRVCDAGSRAALVVAAALAYGSHLLLDWLGDDTTPPIGIMALWPFSRELLPVEPALVPADRAPLLAAGILDAQPARRRRGSCWSSRRWRRSPLDDVRRCDTRRRETRAAEHEDSGVAVEAAGRASVRDARRRPSGGAADTAGTSGRRARRAARRGSPRRRRGR